VFADPIPWIPRCIKEKAAPNKDARTLGSLVAPEKWAKGRRLVYNLAAQLDTPNWRLSRLSYKELELTRGYSCHLSMTFEMLVPHLKGFHLALAAHLPKRDKECWKMSDKQWQVCQERDEDS
jgi:hypothetical protein